MNPATLSYDQLIERITQWAQPRPDIRAAVILGSRARVDQPADAWSDLDTLLVVTDPRPYLANADWLKSIGDFRITFLESTATGNEMERRVLFDGGLDVDFSIIPSSRLEQMTQYGVPPEVAEALRRGMHVLFDKDGVTGRLNVQGAEPAPARPWTKAEFLEMVDDFWYHAVWTAKKFARGELWTAKMGCDGYMKRLLLKAVECHARALKGNDYDTWHDGRFIEHWADPRVLEGLRGAFAHYDKADTRRALFATMDLFRWIAKEIADRLAFPYPTDADEYATDLVRALVSETVQTDASDDAQV